jgi:heat-inducible transcriptional repressor
MISELNERSRTVFRYIVDSYLATGEPVGSRTISQKSALYLSPASIRNVMADLEDAGLLYAPHASAGRLPTETGIKLYIEGLMQMGDVGVNDRAAIEAACAARNRTIEETLEEAGNLLSGLSACAGLVIAPKLEGALQQVQFVQLAPRRILVVLVFQSGLIENRVVETEIDVPAPSLIAASNYLNSHLKGRTMQDAEIDIRREIAANETRLDLITQNLVQKGLALAPAGIKTNRLIIRGQSHLLQDVRAIEDLERARILLTQLEQQQTMLNLLTAVDGAEGVQIFIGADNRIFDLSGWSMIISPYRDAQDKVVGAIGVIGPTRLDYDRIIPMVDFTSRVVSKLVDGI